MELKAQNIKRLDIKDDIIQILEKNNINKLGELCGKSKSELKDLDLTTNQVNKIEVEMQLVGLCLKNSL